MYGGEDDVLRRCAQGLLYGAVEKCPKVRTHLVKFAPTITSSEVRRSLTISLFVLRSVRKETYITTNVRREREREMTVVVVDECIHKKSCWPMMYQHSGEQLDMQRVCLCLGQGMYR